MVYLASHPGAPMEVKANRTGEIPETLRQRLLELGVVELTVITSVAPVVRRKNLKLAKAPGESKPVVDWRDL